MRKFDATLRAQEMVGTDAWTFLPLPQKVVGAFDSCARTAVRGTLNGVAFRSSIFPDGDGGFHMMVNAKLYVEWIEEAKRPETKAGRVSKTAEMLLAGKKRAR
jgi:hypothetical protein